MAQPTDPTAPLSDTETSAERPVREQLKKASIAGIMPEDAQAAVGAAGTANGTEGRGRLQRKRSFEEVEGEQQAASDQAQTKQHTRKRSRDSKDEVEEVEGEGRKRLSGEREREGVSAVQAEGGMNGQAKTAAAERAATPERSGAKRAEEVGEEMASPKTKRSRLHSSATGEAENGTLTADPSAPTTSRPPAAASSGTPATKIPAGSAFANSSSTSPFTSLASNTNKSKSPTTTDQQPQTSASAFASSGFGSLAASSTSGFGAIANKPTSGFGSGGSFASSGVKSPLGATAPNENGVPSTSSGSTSAFGGALGQKSAFAAAPAGVIGFGSAAPASGFGKLASASTGGFGGALGGSSAFGGSALGGAGSSGGLASFASGKPSASLSGTPKPTSRKPFGAPAAEDEEDDPTSAAEDKAEEAGYKSPPLATEEEKQDERFYAQQVETGEEEEETAYSCRAKLYTFVEIEEGKGKKEWRERGLGTLRLNVRRPASGDLEDGKGDSGEEAGVKARFLMRADGSHRVVLNTPVKKEISFGAVGGGPPQGGYMFFMGTVGDGGRLELLQLKVGRTRMWETEGWLLIRETDTTAICPRALGEDRGVEGGDVNAARVTCITLWRSSRGGVDGKAGTAGLVFTTQGGRSVF